MDRTTTNFPKVGMEPATTWENVSGRVPSPTRERRSYSSMVEAATAKPRRQIAERLGHKGGIQARMVYQNAEEAAATQRNVYTINRRSGLREFWDKRKYGQAQQ